MSYVPQNTRMSTAEVDFGFEAGGGEGDTATVTVAANWVSTNSIIQVQPSGIASADHDPEDGLYEEVSAIPVNIVPGVSFDILAYAPNGTWGRYEMSYIALIRRITA